MYHVIMLISLRTLRVGKHGTVTAMDMDTKRGEDIVVGSTDSTAKVVI